MKYSDAVPLALIAAFFEIFLKISNPIFFILIYIPFASLKAQIVMKVIEQVLYFCNIQSEKYIATLLARNLITMSVVALIFTKNL